MSNICSLSMGNTHNNVEFGVLQKTSKQSLISIFFHIGEGGHPPPIPTHPPLGTSSLDHGIHPSLHELDPQVSQIRPCPPPPPYVAMPLSTYIIWIKVLICEIYMAIMCTVIHMFHELTTYVEYMCLLSSWTVIGLLFSSWIVNGPLFSSWTVNSTPSLWPSCMRMTFWDSLILQTG